MKISKGLLITITISFFAYLFFQSNHAYAAKVSLGVYPPIVKIKTPPGSHIQQQIRVTNYADTPSTILIIYKEFHSSDKKNGEIEFLPETNEIKNFLSQSVKLLDDGRPINQMLLSPNQQKNLLLDIRIPKEAQGKDYYISILFVSNNAQEIKSNASLISSGIATNVLLSILNQPQQDIGYIKSFSAPTFINHGPVPFTLELANQGNHYFVTKGKITINTLFFNSHNTIDLPLSTVLENSSRYIASENGNSLDGPLWNQGFLFGIYRADAQIQFGDNPEIFHKIIYFYSYPIISLIAVSLFIIFLGIIFFKIYKKQR